MEILVVDDDMQYVKMITEALEDHGFKVSSAYDGIKAMQLAVEKKPNVILLDYKLPGGNGPLILDRLHRNASTTSIPVIMVTGVSDEKDLEQVKRMGVREVFSKPLSVVNLIAALKALESA